MTGTVPAESLEARESLAPSRPPRWAIVLLAALLTASWSMWALHAVRADLRTVTPAELRSDLATGTVYAYIGYTEFEPDRVWPPGDAGRFSTTQVRGLDDSAVHPDAPVVAVGYYVDAWRAPMRVVLLGGPGAVDALELVRELEAAGVPSWDDVTLPPDWHPNPAADAASWWGVTTGALALVALLAIQPTRGTRWFWFWVFGMPLGLGIPAYVVAECLWPRRAEPTADGHPPRGRLAGLVGLATAFVARVLVPH